MHDWKKTSEVSLYKQGNIRDSSSLQKSQESSFMRLKERGPSWYRSDFSPWGLANMRWYPGNSNWLFQPVSSWSVRSLDHPAFNLESYQRCTVIKSSCGEAKNLIYFWCRIGINNDWAEASLGSVNITPTVLNITPTVQASSLDKWSQCVWRKNFKRRTSKMHQ